LPDTLIHEAYARLQNLKTQIVMPAWIAGIQIRKDASGAIHVNRFQHSMLE